MNNRLTEVDRLVGKLDSELEIPMALKTRQQSSATLRSKKLAGFRFFDRFDHLFDIVVAAQALKGCL